MLQRILIIDFGSQYTQLIARRVREFNVYCEIHPFHHTIEADENVIGIILSGSPSSVNDHHAPVISLENIPAHLPMLGICYGAQLMTKLGGGHVSPSTHREYGRASLIADSKDIFFDGIEERSDVWMSHGDTITEIAHGYSVIARTDSIPVAAFKHNTLPRYGIQFHPEVTHTANGRQILQNFVMKICKAAGDWTPEHFISDTVRQIKTAIGNDRVIMGLSGGVDSTVAATLIEEAIGDQLQCIFIDNGLLRKNEFENVLITYEKMGLNVKGVQAADQFYAALAGISDPELKRKAIGKTFIDIFEEEAAKIEDAKWLGQGTIYPDVIESVSVKGPSVTIKSHHNVGGLPEKMNLKVIEPLRLLFKDEVRKVGSSLSIPEDLLGRHPFPGPGLGIRILGEISEERVKMLQEADHIFIDTLKEFDEYDRIWQAGAILLPVNTVGVMGDERTYENAVALRAVTSVDGMTADWAHLPYTLMATISNRIINQVKGINRVVYDISSKPPATIEWE